MTEIQWAVYYGDGNRVTSAESTLEALDPYDICCIVCPDRDVGRIIMYGWDWYIFKEDGVDTEWSGHDAHGLADQLLHEFPKIKKVAQGRCYSTRKFQEVYQRAAKEGDEMLPKDGWKPREGEAAKLYVQL